MISTIVPVYNAGQYLRPLIESILGQTYSDIELLLIDDGSTDGSGEVCDEYAYKDMRVKAIHRHNSGQSVARNIGLQAARGEFIAFADHDDKLHPMMYEVMLAAMATMKCAVCACGFRNVDQSVYDGIEFLDDIAKPAVIEEKELIDEYMTPTWRIPIWNKLYRRDILSGLFFHEGRIGEDNVFSYRVIRRCKRMAFIDSTLYFQRMHGDNFEFTAIKHMIDLLLAKEYILNDIHENYKSEYCDAQKLFVYECLRIYNLFAVQDGGDWTTRKRQAMDILCRNSRGFMKNSFPLGHKLLIMRLKLTRAKCHKGIIKV